MASLDQSLERVWKGGEGALSQLLDAIVLLLLVSAGSWAFDHTPGGWIATNPSPFFLIPLLMGGRYGQIPGLLSGALAGILLLVAAVVFSGLDLSEAAGAWKFVLICLPLSGLICGEVREALFKDAARAVIQLDQSSHRLRALDEQVFILTETKDELDRELALFNADTANLDYEIRRVLQSPPERFCEALLGVFCRKAELYEAAIYVAGSPWRRAAFSGKPEIWPEYLKVEGSAVARVALAHSSIATLPQVWGHEPAPSDDFLVACPIGEAGGPSFILLVKSMSFSSMTTRGMQIIEIICRWISKFTGLDCRTQGLYDPRRIVPLADFDRMLDLACTVQKKFRLISALILFRPSSGRLATTERIVRAVTGAVRVGDILCTLDSPHPHIVLLLPLTGRRGAEICVERFRDFAGLSEDDGLLLDGEIFCTNDFPARESMWAAVHSALDRS